jgi:hypothetical protein
VYKIVFSYVLKCARDIRLIQAVGKQEEWAAYRHTTETKISGANMQSVIEENDLSELMNMVCFVYYIHQPRGTPAGVTNRRFSPLIEVEPALHQ